MRGRQPGLQAVSVVGGLAEAATGPAGPASYRLERPRTVVDPRARTPRCEVRGLRLRVGNSQPRQQSSPQGASTPRPRIAAPKGACGPIPVGARINCGSLLGCEPAQGWARATRWVSFPPVMTLVVLASPPRLPTETRWASLSAQIAQ